MQSKNSNQLYKIHASTYQFLFTYSHIIIIYSGILNLYLLWYICHWTLGYKQKL